MRKSEVRKYSKLSKTREITLRNKKKANYGAFYPKRPCITRFSRFSKFNARPGYSFVYGDSSLFNLKQLIQLKDIAYCIHNPELKAAVIQDLKSRGDYGPAIVNKRLCEIQDRRGAYEDSVMYITMSDAETYLFKELEGYINQVAIKHTEMDSSCLEGPMVVGPGIKNKDIGLIFGFALCYYLLQVPAWFNTELKFCIDYYICNEIRYVLQSEDENEEPAEIDNWHGYNIDLPSDSNTQPINTKDLEQCEIDWNNGKVEMLSVFAKVLKRIPVKRLKAELLENTDKALWLRCIIWLVIEGFNFIDYSAPFDTEMQDYGGVATSESCALLWDFDDYLDVYDMYNNGYRSDAGWGTMGYSTYYFKDFVLKPVVKDPKTAMRIFRLMSSFNCYLNTYSDEVRKNLQTLVSLDSIHGWQRVLRGRIKSIDRRDFSGV